MISRVINKALTLRETYLDSLIHFQKCPELVISKVNFWILTLTVCRRCCCTLWA